MRIPSKVAQEMDDFLRYLALTPQEGQRFRLDPEQMMRQAKLSEAAADCIRDNGMESTMIAVQAKRDDIMEHPDSWKRTNFNRDRSVGGFGGNVIKKG